jgi:DNA segregation ATPase FtsK/SpoIIIE, S-DNA-T family
MRNQSQCGCVHLPMDFLAQPRLPSPPLSEGDVAVQAPPDVPRLVSANPLARLLPVAMVVAMVGMMVIYFTSAAPAMRNPMFMFFPVMMLVSLLGTMAYGVRGTSRAAEINQDRRDYLRYLDTLERSISKTYQAQHASLAWNHPDPCTLWTLVGGRRMWERRTDDVDFGHVRVGLATQRLSTRLVAPELGPIDELDPVTSMALRRLIRHRSTVPNLPVALALMGFAAVTVDGDLIAARGLLRAVSCQLAVMHSPQHLRIMAVVDPLTVSNWDWLKWLPHHQHPQAFDIGGSARMMYHSLADAENAVGDIDAGHVVLILDGGLIAGDERLFTLLGLAGVTVLEVGTACEPVAGQKGLRLAITADALTARSNGRDEAVARPDTLTLVQSLTCARRLAPFRPATSTDAAGLVASFNWPELMGVGDPAAIDPAVVWRARNSNQRLRVPIGVSDQGLPVELDIKEAAEGGMGPHGLCVGATGSGKSEFLRTLTLGMITAHPPEVLNLVLVDFKGGATFLGFERAAHVAAVITNLADESHLVARMKDALAGEVNRRQELLRATGNFANIADYERARVKGTALAPLPVLFIVVDEFSELLSQHPDFAELFVAIGRLGRSLGMHLLLASQRLDEGRLRGLESHLSYRVCLKTFSTNESRAVLGVPDAYHLPNAPGTAYLKTGSGEPLRFQAAFVSGPRQHTPTQSDELSVLGPQIFTAAPMGDITNVTEHRSADTATSNPNLLDTVLDRLEGRGTPAHSVWLPPLAEPPTLDALLQLAGTRAPLNPPIGLVDCPFEQRRDVLIAQLSGSAGHVAVVGGPRSGKSTAIRTLVLALAATHDPRDVQVYCLDFGGGALSSLWPLPHVGSVAGRRDVDLIRRTVADLESILRTREARFRRAGVDSITDYRRRRAIGDPAVSDDAFGDVFLVIDGWATVRQEFDHLEGPITAVAAQGLSYGVHLVVAASRWAEIRPALKDLLGTRIELRLGDPAESEMDRRRARHLVDSPPGRGLTRSGREVVVALPRLDGRSETVGIADAIAASAEWLQARYEGRVAPPVELLPTRVDRRAVIASSAEQQATTQILLGIEESELRPVAIDFANQAHLVVLGEGECGKTATLRMLCQEIVRTNSAASAQLVVADFRRTLLGVVESEHLAGYAMSAATLTAKLPMVLNRLQARMPGPEVSQQQIRGRSWWSGPEIYLVVDDYDLVAGANDNPLVPLLDFLPHARDVGLHVVIARRSGGAARAMFDPILARLRDLGCIGLMMSASPEEGVLLGSVRPSPLPPGRGTLVTRGRPDQIVQVAWSDPP